MRRLPVSLLAAAGMCWSAGAQEADLQQQVADLRARIAALQSAHAGESRHTQAVLEDVLRDAQRRSAILAGEAPAGAGYDGGFFIRSGAFELRPSIAALFRHTATWADAAGARGEDVTESGFEIRRIDLKLGGTAFSPDLEYAIIWKTPREGGRPVLDEAFILWRPGGGPWGFKLGQFDDNVYQEFNVGFKRQLAAEKSLLNEVMMEGCFDIVQGAALVYGAADKPVRLDVALHDGALSMNTPYFDSPSDVAVREHFGLSGRAEWKLAGQWKDYRDFSARDAREDLLVLGIGADITQGIFADAGGAGTGGNRTFAALDVQWELARPKIGIFGAVVCDHTSFHGPEEDRLNWGALVQAGWAIDRRWEVFLRYDIMFLDDEFLPAGAEDVFHEITTGVTYFLSPDGSFGHRAKLTFDIGYLPTGSPVRATGLGIFQAGDEPMLYARAQLLLVL
jgi:hypothetical protein